MKKSTFPFISGIIALALQAQPAKADISTNALWTFDTTAPVTAGPISPEFGSGSGLGHHAAGAAAYTSPAGDASLKSWSANNWAVGDYWQFSTTLDLIDNTYGGFSVSYAQNGSATGPGTFFLSYSTDGTTFTKIGADYTLTSGITWVTSGAVLGTLKSFDLSGNTDLNTASTVYFRVVDDSATSITGGAVGTGGTSRIDNFLITSTITSVPEPSAFALATIGGLGCFFAMRRNKR